MLQTKRSKFLKIITASLLIVAVIVFASYKTIRENVHTIIPGEFYRSAQLDPRDFAKLIEAKHIRSIINLRGPNPQWPWYRAEIKMAQSEHINHYDLALSGIHLPEPDQMRMLVRLLETAPRPVLIHCHGGADRTGLAAAIVIILQGGQLQAAKKQISVFYLAVSSQSVGRLVMPYYERWLQQQKLVSNRQNFLMWVKNLHRWQESQA